MKLHQTQSIPRPGAWRLAARLGAFAVAAALAGEAQAQTPQFGKLWEVPAGSYADLPTTGNNVRGIAISPITTNVIFGSTAGATNIGINTGVNNHATVLDYMNGSNYLRQLKTVTNGSQVNLSYVRVADDGRVYGVSVTTAATGANQAFRIYQWPSETDVDSEAIEVFNSTNVLAPNSSFPFRLGDHMDVRGGGTNTEIVVVGNSAASTNLVFFRPTDDTLTNFSHSIIPVSAGAAAAYAGNGVTFEGTNNVVWIRQNGASTTRRVAYDPVALTSTITSTNNVDTASINGIKHYFLGERGLLAGIHVNAVGTTNRVRVFSIPTTAGTAMGSIFTNDLPVPGNSNPNGLGAVDFRNGFLVGVAPNNGICLYQITNVIVTVSISPSLGGDLIEGQPLTYTAVPSAGGATTYQWYYQSNAIPNATNTTISFPSVQVADSGLYSVIISNEFFGLASNAVTLTVLPEKYTAFATNLWTLAPGSRSYLTVNDTQRGLAYDAVSNVVLLVTRSPATNIHILDADTGADVGVLDTAFLQPPNVVPGTLKINMIGVADDGVVYAANLLGSGLTDNLAIYRWGSADPSATPTQAYFGNPGIERMGDTMSVRGSGVNTEILFTFRSGPGSTNVAIFTTTDGFNFTPNIIAVTNLPPEVVAAIGVNSWAGLGADFGAGNTFWVKSSGGFFLRHVEYDLASLTASVIGTYTNLPASVAPLGVDPINDYVATISFTQNPQNLSIWDVSQGPPNAVQLDRELFGSNNANGNGTGSVAFDVNGGRIFALNSNNGLIALAYAPRLTIDPTPAGGIVTWTGPGTLQASTNLASGVWTDLPAATSPHTNTAAKEVFFRVKR